MRHGESQWNQENRFTGWADVDLTDNGRDQAAMAGQLLKEKGFQFDLVFTSFLKRAIRTAWITLDALDAIHTPIGQTWRLNERHYGVLQGLNKAETAEQYGDEQVLIWRRAYDIAPDPMTQDDPRHPRFDSKYKRLKPEQIPSTECLKDTVARVQPFWHESIAPAIKSGRNVLVTAHGNSLRALLKIVADISDEDIVGINIPTAQPMVIELNEDMLATNYYYLGDDEAIKAQIAAVASQGKAG